MLRCILICLLVAPSAILALKVPPEKIVGGPGQTTHNGELLDMLWDGFDLTDEDLATLRCDRQSANLSDTGPVQLVHLLGPPDSGTNLMVQMLKLNLPGHVPDKNLDQKVWKHSLSSAGDIQRIFAEMLGDDVKKSTLIIMVRTPMAHFAAWRRKPYGLAPCFERPIDVWSTPCFTNSKPHHHAVTPGVDINVKDSDSNLFDSSMDVYNDYMQQYLELKSENGFRNVVMVPFEDLVYTPEITLSSVAASMGAHLPASSVHVVESSAKGEKGHGRKVALRKLRSRSFLADIGAARLPALCDGIERKSISALREGTHTRRPRPYTEDCARINKTNHA